MVFSKFAMVFSKIRSGVLGVIIGRMVYLVVEKELPGGDGSAPVCTIGRDGVTPWSLSATHSTECWICHRLDPRVVSINHPELIDTFEKI